MGSGRVTEALEARKWVENSVPGIPEELFAFTFLSFFSSFLLVHGGKWEVSMLLGVF